MTKTSQICWLLMPQFLERIRRFSQSFTVTGRDNAAMWFEACFGSGDERMLGIGIIERQKEDDPPKLVGHLLAGCESYLGAPHGVVYQFSKDKGTDFVKGDDPDNHPYIVMRHMLDYWGRGNNIDQIYALVDGPARAKLFGWFGFDDKMRIVRMNVNVDTGVGG
jgi:hypothetical protein